MNCNWASRRQRPNRQWPSCERAKQSNAEPSFAAWRAAIAELSEKHQEKKSFGFCEIEKDESTAVLPAKAIPKAYLAAENALEQTVQCALYFLNDFSGVFRILLKIHIVDIKNQ
jgi:hypothetical protein